MNTTKSAKTLSDEPVQKLREAREILNHMPGQYVSEKKIDDAMGLMLQVEAALSNPRTGLADEIKKVHDSWVGLWQTGEFKQTVVRFPKAVVLSHKEKIDHLAELIPPDSPDDGSERFRSEFSAFTKAMVAKFVKSAVKHPKDNILDNDANVANWDDWAIESHLVEELCEFFALEQEDFRAIMDMIRRKKDFYAFANSSEDRGRAGVVDEPDREKEAIDIANMAFVLYFKMRAAKPDDGET